MRATTARRLATQGATPRGQGAEEDISDDLHPTRPHQARTPAMTDDYLGDDYLSDGFMASSGEDTRDDCTRARHSQQGQG